GVVAINAIRLDRMPQFDYDTLLWGERQIRSVANMTRADARDFLALAAEIGLRPRVTVFSLDQANEALMAVKRDAVDGAAVIVPHGGPDFDQSYLLPEMDRLSDSYRLIYYDQRGRGKSANNVRPEDVTLASDVADLEKVRQFFHLESAALLGHSWGTVIALEYALKYPQRISHLILMNPGPASREDYLQLRKDWLEKRPDAMSQRKAIAETAA